MQKYPIKIFAYGECEISAFGRCDMSGFVRRDINLLRKFVKYPASQDVIVTEPKNESNVGVYRIGFTSRIFTNGIKRTGISLLFMLNSL